MERKHKITIIGLIIIMLVLLIGTSYAYFSMRIQDTRDKDEETTKFKTCKIAEATTISDIPESLGSFQSTDIYPGHKEVIGMSVSARGEIHSISNFEFLYHMNENTFGNNIKVSIYKSKEVIPTTENYFACEKKVKTIGNQVMYYEECQEKELGSLIEETILSNNQETIRIGKDSIVVTSNQEEIRYYYVVLEFLNQEDNQNITMSSKLSGNITINPTLEKTSYKESILNGTDPILKDELIPVIIDNDGVVRKADEAEEWYSYENKIWANAVILNDESEMYCPGEIIPEDNIESYFVWIPKYRYQLWDLGNYSSLTNIDNTKPHEIPILFGDYNTVDSVEGECTTPMTSGASGNCQIGDYMTHPSFISFDTKGFWVGKFETGYKGSTSMSTAESNTKEPEKVQIKPNVNSWRGIQVANAYVTSFDYKRNLDSHMMKNTEWGAVAYLQHSKYGSMASVRFNNNNLQVTGYSAVKEPVCDNKNPLCNQYGTDASVTQPYNTLIGYLASTTGNISGIYDMSGGSWEYVMGLLLDVNGQLVSGRNSINNSGFNGIFGCPTCDGDTSELTELTDKIPFLMNSKYYDSYILDDNCLSYQRRILGDATGEMGAFGNRVYDNEKSYVSSWYQDEALFVYMSNPWMMRSGIWSPGPDAGIFSFHSSHGNSSSHLSFRLVLAM